MAVGTVSLNRQDYARRSRDMVLSVPVSVSSDWMDICTAPETADNSGSSVVLPLAISRAEQSFLDVNGLGTTLQIRLKYDDALTSPTNPVVQPFGFDGNNSPQQLVDVDGIHELELTVAPTTDVQDGTYKYTKAVEVDMDGSSKVLVAIKTAFDGTGVKNNSCIQARVK